MCGRFLVEIDADELREIVEEAEKNANHEPEQLTFSGGEIFPSAMAPVITDAGVRFMKWGFPSLFPNRPAHINTKSETALTLPTFRTAMQHRRCLVPATAYYEWKNIGKRQKEKYEFFVSTRKIFFMAGIYSPSNEFSILTREASREFSVIHERMPVVISRSDMRQWLLEAPSVMERAFTDFSYRHIESGKPEQTSFLV